MAKTMLIWLFIPLLAAFQITGVPPDPALNSGTLPIRREINEFATAGAEFDLYILALQRLQALNQTEMLSYFQISGIHGYPVGPWDGVTGSGTYPGFCMHATVVFPTWHRVYLALFEQEISMHAQVIAQMYPPDQRDQYQMAAQTMRIPYWDWAINPGLPAVTTSPNISVNTPDGFQSISNPLYQYTFHPGDEGNGFPAAHPLASLPSTTRYYNFQTGQRNDSAATSILLANAPSTLAMTYQLLSSVTDYNTMSCTYPGGHPNRLVNLETIHNNIHNFVGGYYGTMTWPELSAFDPIFWLHHANVDRLFALWQALNPNVYVVPTKNAYGSFAELRGTIDSEYSSLAPFHMDNDTTLFTSNGVRNIAVLGYSYPELMPQNSSALDLAAAVREQVNTLYAPSAASKVPRHDTQVGSSIKEAFSRMSFEKAKNSAINNQEYQWSIHIEVDQNSLNTSYNIDFFVGTPPTASKRAVATNLVGTYGQFVIDNGCDNNAVDRPVEILSGEVSVTHALVAAVSRGFLLDLCPAVVVPILRDHLVWTARTADDQDIPVHKLSGLSISVRSRSVQRWECDAEFPSYGPVVIHTEVTDGKAGGVRQTCNK